MTLDVRPWTGPERIRHACAITAGWVWCDQHRRSRYNGADPCDHLHPAAARPDDPAWCHSCERWHGPMEWGDGCEDAGDLAERFAVALRHVRRPRILHPSRRAALAWHLRCAWIRLRNEVAVVWLRIRQRR